MEKLWLVQKNKDGTYGNWKEFKENKEGIVIVGDKIYKYIYGRDAENKGSIISKEVKKVKILILEGLYGNNKGKKCQWRLKRTNLKVGDRVVLDCHDYKVIKVVEEKRKKILILKRKKAYENKGEDRYIKVKMNDPRLYLYRPENSKVGDEAVFGDRKIWKIFKILEVKKKKLIYTENAELIKNIEDNYQKNMEKFQLQELRNRPYFKTIITEVKGKPSRGENLEKIKFPCFCSYIERVTGERRYGKLDKSWDDIAYKDKYQISKIIKQTDGISVLHEDISLEKLMENLKIEILKGEIHLWREVG